MAPIAPAEAQSRTVARARSLCQLRRGRVGDLLLLVHGMAGTAENWSSVIEPLALHHHVIAPDFPGHGSSEPGGGDYSLGSLASGLRDLMLALGHERATVVGHSLGGGVALQFTYQFPEMVERLVLVSSGGLGPDVSPILRAAALPGADLFIAATATVGAAPAPCSGAVWAGSACVPTPTWPRLPAATPRSSTASGAVPSSPPCDR